MISAVQFTKLVALKPLGTDYLSAAAGGVSAGLEGGASADAGAGAGPVASFGGGTQPPPLSSGAGAAGAAGAGAASGAGAGAAGAASSVLLQALINKLLKNTAINVRANVFISFL